jgi:hypothetical protein
MKLMVLTTEPITATQLRDALPGPIEPRDAEVMVIAPALHASALRFWASDADEAIEKAEAVRRETLRRLGDEGVSASGDTGEGDLMKATEDALRTFAADRIVIFSHPSDESRYREDVDDDEIRQRFGLPVDLAEVRAG